MTITTAVTITGNAAAVDVTTETAPFVRPSRGRRTWRNKAEARDEDKECSPAEVPEVVAAEVAAKAAVARGVPVDAEGSAASEPAALACAPNAGTGPLTRLARHVSTNVAQPAV
jgi:hypothetical protein